MIRLLLGISTIAYALYIFSFSPQFYNDDSLFLARGIESFSVIDFAPHFPGYVSVVILGKLLNVWFDDAIYSLFVLSALCAILLPWIIYEYVKSLGFEKAALGAFFLTLSSVYLNNLALSMLSDSVGLFLFFVSLYVLEKGHIKLTGILLALAIFARPSYMIFYVVGLLYISLYKPQILKTLLLCFLATFVMLFAYIYVYNGDVYFIEGWRFVQGHFELWGKGQNSQYSWSQNIFIWMNVPLVLLVFHKLKKELILLYGLFLTYGIWILLAQNPENIRHLIPLIFMAFIFVAITFENKPYVLAFLVCFNGFFYFEYTQKNSPLEQLTSVLPSHALIISNRNIETLRSKGFLVVDKYYASKSEFYKKEKKAYIISGDKKEFSISKEYKGRFIGERPLYMYETKPN